VRRISSSWRGSSDQLVRIRSATLATVVGVLISTRDAVVVRVVNGSKDGTSEQVHREHHVYSADLPRGTNRRQMPPAPLA
jgi:hypothetical protein